MKLKNLILIFLIGFIPNAYGMETNLDQIENYELTLDKEFTSIDSNKLIDRPGFECDPTKNKNLILI